MQLSRMNRAKCLECGGAKCITCFCVCPFRQHSGQKFRPLLPRWGQVVIRGRLPVGVSKHEDYHMTLRSLSHVYSILGKLRPITAGPEGWQVRKMG